MQPCLSATHSVAAPDRAGEERRKALGCEERVELNCPTSEMDWWEQTSEKCQTSNLFTFPSPNFGKAGVAFQNNMPGLLLVTRLPKINKSTT